MISDDLILHLERSKKESLLDIENLILSTLDCFFSDSKEISLQDFEVFCQKILAFDLKEIEAVVFDLNNRFPGQKSVKKCSLARYIKAQIDTYMK